MNRRSTHKIHFLASLLAVFLVTPDLAGAQSGAQAIIDDVRFTAKELAASQRRSDKAKRNHQRRVERAGYDPLDEFSRLMALSLFDFQLESLWGDGTSAKNPNNVQVTTHITGQIRTTSAAINDFKRTIETVYGGSGPEARICMQTPGANPTTARIIKSNLGLFKNTLGIPAAQQRPYRVLTGTANGEPVVMKEGIHLSSGHFNEIRRMLKTGKPLTVRFIGGLKAATKGQKKRAASAARKLGEGPTGAVFIWTESTGSWDIRYEIDEGAAKTLRKLLKANKDGKDSRRRWIEFELKDGRIGIEYPQYYSAPNDIKDWPVATVAYDAANGLISKLFHEYTVGYSYHVEQYVQDCELRVTIEIVPRRIVLGKRRSVSLKDWEDVTGIKVINTEMNELVTGFLDAPNCSGALISTSGETLTTKEFDAALKVMPECRKSCDQVREIAVKANRSAPDISACRNDCVERSGFRKCISRVKRVDQWKRCLKRL